MQSTLRTCLLLSSLLLSACSSTLQVVQPEVFQPEPAMLGVEQADRHWWQLRFRLAWPEGEAPDLSRHPLIAEQILLPVIAQNQAQIPLWRFHRRAGRDAAGHQFSLIFYADDEVAARVGEQVESNPLTQWLIDEGMLEKSRLGRRTQEEVGRLEQTSDRNWPMPIQRSWPYFIMGASQTWLLLVQELSAQQALPDELDYEELLAHYRQVDTRLNELWRENGQHAYFHHLSAIFGYQPLKIRSSELKTF